MLFGFKDVELDIPSHVGVRSMEVKGAHSSTHVGTKHHPFVTPDIQVLFVFSLLGLCR